MIGNISVSVVSHGHERQVQRLLQQLAHNDCPLLAKVVVTINSSRFDCSALVNAAQSLPITVEFVHNATARGFGANHNHAYSLCNSTYFCVMNPDIEQQDSAHNPFPKLLEALAPAHVAMAYPAQVDDAGQVLDFERSLVTPFEIVHRHTLGYHTARADGRVHWANGACMVFKSSVFGALRGFDERYFMYCEDVDICLRAQLAGYTLARADTTVLHHTHRRTLKSPRHLAWHLGSLLQLWQSEAYQDFKLRLVAKRP